MNNIPYYRVKSLMAKCLEQAFQWHEMYCYNLEVMSSNPGQVELGGAGELKVHQIRHLVLLWNDPSAWWLQIAIYIFLESLCRYNMHIPCNP